MGHDISPIGNHQLPTEDIKTLAEHISSLLDINIEYGYFGERKFFKLLGEKINEEFIVLGKIIKDENLKTYKLIEYGYQLKQLHQKFGDKIFYNPEYRINYNGNVQEQERIKQLKEELVFPNFELFSDENEEHINIYKELYSNFIPYFSRWWSFCSLFTESKFESIEYLDYLNIFRKEIMGYALIFGGDKVYYLNDQSNVLYGFGGGCESNFRWNEFENYVSNKSMPLMLNIPKFLTDRYYRKEFLALKKNPLSFIDDFSDLK